MRRSLPGIAAAALLAAIVVAPKQAYSTSYDPLPHGEEGAAAPGATVFLFHGGSAEARHLLGVGEVLAVFWPAEDGTSHIAGKIRVVAAGAVCVRGEVLEGSVRVHYLGAREGIYYLVVPEAVCGR